MMANGFGDGPSAQRSGKVVQFALVMGCTVWLLCLMDHGKNRGNELNISIKQTGINTLGRKGKATPASVSSLEESGRIEAEEVSSAKNPENEADEKLSSNEAKEGSLLADAGMRFAVMMEKIAAGNNVQEGSVSKGSILFQDENGVPPDMKGVYLQKS